MISRKKNSERGQVAILFAMVFTFIFVLFAFVVDFSHLINNKINLQIAADQAAYAGAAWQARVLNRVGHVNYYLRQNLKEMSMRVNVTHLRHNRNFPRGRLDSDAQHTTEPFVCQQAHGYRALSGLQYDRDTNLCKNASPSTGGLPPIVVPPVIARFDPFAVAIAAQIRRIQQAANQECQAAANDNRLLAQHLVNSFSQRSQFRVRQIQALQNYLNEAAQETDGASSDHEIIKTAYQTALRNLTLSNTDGFRMEVLTPEGGEWLRLNQQDIRGSVFFIDFQVQGNGCVGRPNFLDFDNMTAGFSKEESIVTYFAVKLTSTPRLFFMPANWIEAGFPQLEAFAVAKPFGSRIGPQSNADVLVPSPTNPGNNSRLINFAVRPGDRLGMAREKLMAYYDALHPFAGGRPDGNRQTGWPEPGNNNRQALQAIRAPTVFDATFFTVFPDPGSNANTDYEDPNIAEAMYPDYLQAGEATNNSLIQRSPPRTPAYFPSEVGPNGFIAVQANVNTGGPYGGYTDEGPSSHSVTSAVGLPLVNGDQQAASFGFATPRQIRSGWAPPDEEGRIGYSVKFIGMDALVRTMQVRQNEAGTLGRIQNPPTGDPNINNVIH